VSGPDVFAAETLACRRGERAVFAGLGFTLPSGGALCLVGPNGSGKTSLLRLLAGFSQPAAGRLTWNGVAVADDREAHAARVHYVGHQDGLKPALTVAENLGFWARMAEPHVSRRTIDGALERFGLHRLADEPARILSAGQRRRLALSRLLVTDARLWLLDEPNAALDVASLGLLATLIRQHRQADGMVVLSAHVDLDIDDGQSLALDRFPPPLDAEAWS
jgi:heme exporter protein A